MQMTQSDGPHSIQLMTATDSILYALQNEMDEDDAYAFLDRNLPEHQM